VFAAYALPRGGVTTPSQRASALIEPLRVEAAQTDREGAYETLAQVGRGHRVVGRLYEGHVNALLPIERHDGDAQRARRFADAVSGCLFGVWNTQAEGGAAMAAAGHGWRLTGAKTFASGRGQVERALVTAARQDGDGQLSGALSGARAWQRGSERASNRSACHRDRDATRGNGRARTPLVKYPCAAATLPGFTCSKIASTNILRQQ